MRLFTIGLASLLLFPILARGDITYNLVNYPADQVMFVTGNESTTATLSGTITTDGTIGTLSGTDIVSWSVTVSANYSSSDGTYHTNTFGSNVPGVTFPMILDVGVVATSTSLLLPESTTVGYTNWLSLQAIAAVGVEENITWSRSPVDANGNGGDDYNATTFGPWITWDDSNYRSEILGIPNGDYALGGNDPWVIATIVTAVPEPSTLAVAGTGTLLALRTAWRKRRKTSVA